MKESLVRLNHTGLIGPSQTATAALEQLEAMLSSAPQIDEPESLGNEVPESSDSDGGDDIQSRSYRHGRQSVGSAGGLELQARLNAPGQFKHDSRPEEFEHGEENAEAMSHLINSNAISTSPGTRQKTSPRTATSREVDSGIFRESERLKQITGSNISRKRALDLADHDVMLSNQEEPSSSSADIIPHAMAGGQSTRSLSKPKYVYANISYGIRSRSSGAPNPYEIERSLTPPPAEEVRSGQQPKKGRSLKPNLKPKSRVKAQGKAIAQQSVSLEHGSSIGRRSLADTGNVQKTPVENITLDYPNQNSMDVAGPSSNTTASVAKTLNTELEREVSTHFTLSNRSNVIQESLALKDSSISHKKLIIPPVTPTAGALIFGGSKRGRPMRSAGPVLQRAVSPELGDPPNIMQAGEISSIPSMPPHNYESGDYPASNVMRTPRKKGQVKLKRPIQIQAGRRTQVDGDEGISDILMNPSPIELAMLPRTANSQTGDARYGNKDGEVDQVNIVGHRDKAEAPDANHGLFVAEFGDSGSPDALFQANWMPSTDRDRDKMLDLIAIVGTDSKGVMKPSDTPRTGHAKAIKDSANQLQARYDKIRQNRQSNPMRESDIKSKVHPKMIRLLKLIETEANDIVVRRVGKTPVGDKDKTECQRMLYDIQIHIIPALVKCIDSAIKTFSMEAKLDRGMIEEVSRQVTVFETLYAAVEKRKKDCQPSKYKFKVAGPISELNPIMRRLQERFRNAIDALMRAESSQRNAPLRAIKRKQAEEEANAATHAFLQQRRQRIAENIALLGMTRTIYDIPSFTTQSFSSQSGRLSTNNLGRSQPSLIQVRATAAEEKVKRLARELQEAQNEARKLKHTEQCRRQCIDNEEVTQEEDPFSEPLEAGRVYMFGQNNKHSAIRPEPWTRIEMETLVDGLRQEEGIDRYEIIAERLDRNLDEIFEKAKDFKVTMEDRHEQLRQKNSRAYYPELESWIRSIGSEGVL